MINQGVGVGPGSAARRTTSTSRRQPKKSDPWADGLIIATPLLLPMDLI